jgi:hypothetical protein
MAAMQKVFMFEANCEEEERWVSLMDVGARTISGDKRERKLSDAATGKSLGKGEREGTEKGICRCVREEHARCPKSTFASRH